MSSIERSWTHPPVSDPPGPSKAGPGVHVGQPARVVPAHPLGRIPAARAAFRRCGPRCDPHSGRTLDHGTAVPDSGASPPAPRRRRGRPRAARLRGQRLPGTSAAVARPGADGSLPRWAATRRQRRPSRRWPNATAGRRRRCCTAGAAEAFSLLARLRRWRMPVVVHPQFTEPHAALLREGHTVLR